MGTLSDATDNVSNQNSTTGNTLLKDENIFENRPGTKKIIRIITVLAYLFSVSFIAILLSAYYVFLWQPPNSRIMYRVQTMERIHAEPLIRISTPQMMEDDKNSVDDIFGKSTYFFSEFSRNQNTSTVFKTQNNPNDTIKLQNSALILHQNNSSNMVKDESMDINRLIDNRFDVSTETVFKMLTVLPNKKSINGTNKSKFSVSINTKTEYLTDNNTSSLLNSHNITSHQHTNIKNDKNSATFHINQQSLQDQPTNNKIFTFIDEESYIEESPGKPSLNQTNFINKLRGNYTIDNKEEQQRPQSINLNTNETTFSVISTTEDSTPIITNTDENLLANR